jgi:transposase
VLRERLKRPPEDGGIWSSKKVAALIAAALGLERVAEQRGWEALRAIGWTIQRPRHAQAAGPEARAEFKKSSPKPSPRRRSAIPAR